MKHKNLKIQKITITPHVLVIKQIQIFHLNWKAWHKVGSFITIDRIIEVIKANIYAYQDSKPDVITIFAL